ncbi:MAG: myo-inosose-2 dehydratase [Hyphomicrobiales bacterium]
MSIHLGIAPIAWTNDDLPALGGDTPLEVCLSEARQAGFSGVEKGNKFPSDASVLAPIMQAHDLRLVSGWFSGKLLEGSIDDEKNRVASQLALFQAMGCPVIVYAETSRDVHGTQSIPISQRPQISGDEMTRYGEKLTQFAEWLAAQGCPLVFHHHMGTIIETEAEVDALMAATGEAVGLLYDTCHMHFAGGQVLATLKRHIARVAHVHFKDVRGPVLAQVRAQDMSFLDAVLAGVFTVPGDGEIDFAGVAQVLVKAGYEGWVVVEAEQDPAKANPADYARMGHAHTAKVLTQAGATVE